MSHPNPELIIRLTSRLTIAGVILVVFPPLYTLSAFLGDGYHPSTTWANAAVFLSGVILLVAAWLIRFRWAPSFLLLPNRVRSGVLLSLLLHAAALVASPLGYTNPDAFYRVFGLLFGFGVIQLAYILPAMAIASWVEHRETAKGIKIAAGVTALLSFLCLGTLCLGNLHTH